MNHERLNESRAKAAIERELSVVLVHADRTGGVDYLTADGSMAVEVTRVTDEAARRSSQAWSRAEKAIVAGPELLNCWLVFVAETTPGLRTLRARVHPLIAELEVQGLRSFDEHMVDHEVDKRSVLGGLFRGLRVIGVQRALSAPRCSSEAVHVHRVFISPGGGGSASGSDEAVTLLCAELATRPDNSEKLLATEAGRRHLFVWVDSFTAFAIERPLRSAPPSWEVDGGGSFGLPTQPPSLPAGVTHLWIVHERTGLGWLWDGTEWRAVSVQESPDVLPA